MFGKFLGMGGAGLLLAVLAGASPGATTQPRFAQDAADLGSADFGVRQSATQRLWVTGKLAEPTLKAATTSDNPEIADRSQTLLHYIDDGIVPSTPPGVIRMLANFRVATDPGERNALIDQMRAAGIDGVRVLLRLQEHLAGRDRMTIQSALQQSPRVAVALLLHDGDRAAAEGMLDSRLAADDALAYWTLHGKAPEMIDQYRRQGDLKMLCRMEWANGQVDAAMRDAHEGSNDDLARGWTAFSANWKALAQQVKAEPIPLQAPRVLGTRAVVCRFAGDSESAERFSSGIRDAGVGNPNGNQGDDNGVGAALAMNDHPDEAAREWGESPTLRSQAAEIYESLLQYKQMLALVDHDPTDPESVRLQAESAGILEFLGQHTAAQAALTQAADTNDRLRDVSVSGALCQSATQMHQTSQATSILLDALSRDADADGWLLDMADIPESKGTMWWWRCLRDREEPADAMQSVQSLAGHHPSKEQAGRLARNLEEWSQSQPVVAQPDIVKAIVSAMKLAGEPEDQQLAVVREHARTFASGEMYLTLGDALVDRKMWAEAARTYGQAVDLDPSAPIPALLQGWALGQAGDTDRGKAMIDLAHLLPLGDMDLRLELFGIARDHGLTDEAERERKLMFAIGGFSTPAIADLLQLCEADAEKQKNYADAERYLQQEMLSAASSQSGGAGPIAYAQLAGGVHRLTAMASLVAHKPDAALSEAALYYKDQPDDVDGLIALVRLADASGATVAGNRLFKMGHDTYQSLCHDYPESGSLHNQLAWAESRCRRDLEDALSQAKKAVSLEPEDTASLDTLSETYYQRHEFQPAIDTIEKCIKLEPDEPHHRKQLARFQLALKTGVVDNE